MSALMPGFRIDKIWGKSGFMTEQYEDKYFKLFTNSFDPRDTRPDLHSEDELADHAVMALYFKNITEVERRVSRLKRINLYGA